MKEICKMFCICVYSVLYTITYVCALLQILLNNDYTVGSKICPTNKFMLLFVASLLLCDLTIA